MAALLALSFASLFAATSASCMHGIQARDLQPRTTNPNFGYTATRGPLLWFTLDQSYGVCATGRNQSPINLDPSVAGIRTLSGGSRPIIDYPRVAETDFSNKGDTVQVTLGSGTLRYENTDYTPQQFHFHVPSEHRQLEEFYPMEVHVVHQRATALPDGSKPLLVLGMLVDVGENSAATKVFRDVIESVNAITTFGSTTKVRDLKFDDIKQHVENNDLYQYSGSLTTPPCSEGVTWLVSKAPVQINATSFNKLKSVIKFNSRYTQNYPGQQNLLEIVGGKL